LAEGVRFLFNKSNRLILIRFLGLTTSIVILNIFLVMINFSEGLIGIFLARYLQELFSNILNNYYLYFISLSLLLFISLILMLLSFKIRLSIFNFIIKIIYQLILIIFKPFEFLKLSNIFLYFKPKKSILQNKIKSKIRSEPTISQNRARINIDDQESKINKVSLYEDDYTLPTIDLLKTSNEKFNSSKESEKRYIEMEKI